MIGFMCTDPGSCDGLIWLLLAIGAGLAAIAGLALVSWVELGAELIVRRRPDLGPWTRRLLALAALGALTWAVTAVTHTATSDWITLPGLAAPAAAIGALLLRTRRRRRLRPADVTGRRGARGEGR